MVVVESWCGAAVAVADRRWRLRLVGRARAGFTPSIIRPWAASEGERGRWRVTGGAGEGRGEAGACAPLRRRTGRGEDDDEVESAL